MRYACCSEGLSAVVAELTRPQRLWQAWTKLWLGRADARRLALFRVVWGVAALVVTIGDGARAADYAPNRFHVPLVGWIPGVWPETYQLLHWAAIGGALLAICGVFSRAGIALVCAVYAYLSSADLLLFRNHVYLLCLLGGILVCAPCTARLALWRNASYDVSGIPRWPEQLLKAQALTVYFWAILAKLNPSYLGGSVLGGDLAATLPESLLGSMLQGPLLGLYPWVLAGLGHAPAMATLSWLVVVAETAILVGLCVPRLRRKAVILGLAVHGSIALLMNVVAFGLLMTGSYVFFWPGSKLAGAGQKRGAAHVEA